MLPGYVDENGSAVLSGWTEGGWDDAVFLKGYQWPFDSRKTEFSSRVDLAVYAAIARGRGAFLDYRRKDEPGRLARLSPEARAYLAKSGAAQDTPFARLWHMNPEAAELFRAHGIDLETELLPVAVCAQHQNGGLCVDAWWRASVPGLFCAGEAAGAFGAYRPGGSALNETQVGSLRAAEWIAARGVPAPAAFAEETLGQIASEIGFLRGAKDAACEDAADTHAYLKRQFSLCAGPVRSVSGMRSLCAWVQKRRGKRFAGDPREAVRLRDALDCAAATLSAMIAQAEHMPAPCGHIVSDAPVAPDMTLPAPDDRFFGYCVETELPPDGEGAHSAVRPVRPLPESGDAWFENVWRDYRDGKIFDIK